jgi:hypothetical protein
MVGHFICAGTEDRWAGSEGEWHSTANDVEQIEPLRVESVSDRASVVLPGA